MPRPYGSEQCVSAEILTWTSSIMLIFLIYCAETFMWLLQRVQFLVHEQFIISFATVCSVSYCFRWLLSTIMQCIFVALIPVILYVAICYVDSFSFCYWLYIASYWIWVPLWCNFFRFAEIHLDWPNRKKNF